MKLSQLLLVVAKNVLSWFNKDEALIKFVENRWGQDLRYAVSSDKIRKLGWSPIHESGLQNFTNWR